MALALLLVSGVVWAGTFTVKNEKDSGPGSLRAAITSANAEPGRDVITFAPSVRGEINLKSALPTLRGELMIRGPGAGKLTVRRAAAYGFRIFTIARSSNVPTNVTISGLRISNGDYSDGGAIRNDGTLTLRGVIVSGNRAFFGGGVYNGGTRDLAAVLKVQGSTFSGNRAINARGDEGRSGGGIYIVRGGTAVITNSTFSGNYAGTGGGVENDGGKLTVEGTTFSGNDAADNIIARGGGIANVGKLAVRNSTFSGNTTDIDGGGIWQACSKVSIVSSTFSANRASSGGGVYHERYAGECTGTVNLRSTIVARNEAPTGPDASGSFRSGGYNLIGNTTGATGFGGSTNLTNTSSGLARGLRDNGGPTKTIALVSSSPAIDAVPRTVCPPPATDQRGVRRPQDGDGDGAARCDIGAYERRTPQ